MKLPLHVALILLVLVPLLVTTWLSERAFREDEATLERQVERLLQDALAPHADTIALRVAEEERALDAIFDDVLLDEDTQNKPEALRDLGLDSPMIEQLFLQAPDGKLR